MYSRRAAADACSRGAASERVPPPAPSPLLPPSLRASVTVSSSLKYQPIAERATEGVMTSPRAGSETRLAPASLKLAAITKRRRCVMIHRGTDTLTRACFTPRVPMRIPSTLSALNSVEKLLISHAHWDLGKQSDFQGKTFDL